MTYHSYLEEARERHIGELKELLRIPSISALAEHKVDCARAADWLAVRLAKAGLEHVEVFPTGGHPLVYGDWLHKPGAPTILVYGHYDVQPVDPVDLWDSPPFEPVLRNGRIYARGASDDKGQVMIHVQALEAVLQAEEKLPVNVKVLLEGEEEIGSLHLASFVQERHDLLKSDVLLISDTAMFAPGVPTICCGLRGIVTLELSVQGPSGDLHSGLYGGAVANPLHVMAELLASLREGQGRVAVEGFYKDVVELSPAERRQIVALPFCESDLAQRLGVRALAGEPGYSAIERMSTRPTLEVNGLWGGFQGEGSKTVIPAAAYAKISCRLVPNQDPEEIARLVANHLYQFCPPSARLEVQIGHGGKPWVCSPDTPAVQSVQRALEDAFDRPVAFARGGGSIPVVDTFARVLNVPIVLVGFAPPDANSHAPNESFVLDTYQRALLASCFIWHELSRINGKV